MVHIIVKCFTARRKICLNLLGLSLRLLWYILIADNSVFVRPALHRSPTMNLNVTKYPFLSSDGSTEGTTRIRNGEPCALKGARTVREGAGA